MDNDNNSILRRAVRKELEYLAELGEGLGQSFEQIWAGVLCEVATAIQESADQINDTTEPVLALEINFETLKAIAAKNGQLSEATKH